MRRVIKSANVRHLCLRARPIPKSFEFGRPQRLYALNKKRNMQDSIKQNN